MVKALVSGSGSGTALINPFRHGGRWSLYDMGGGGQFDPHFFTASGGLLGHVFSILIIIMFKGNIRDYLENISGQYLKNWPRYCNFCRPKDFLQFFEIFVFQT